MAHARDGLRFAPKPRRRVDIPTESLQDLHRRGPFQLGVIGAIDDAHCALADELLDDVGPQPGSRGDWHGPRLCEWLLADRQS